MPTALDTGRQTISLDGLWEVAESFSPTDRPEHFEHRVPVPALTHSATPAFPGIDQFLTPEYSVVEQIIGRPPSHSSHSGAGTPGHSRNYFWYRTSFEAPPERGNARLKVGKAQFGSEVWVNGVRVGSNNSGFTAAFYDISGVIRWSSRNDVEIRIGAHPNVLPAGNTAIFDFEKTRWTPGIWDSVSVDFCDDISIAATQVAPRIDPRQIIVQTRLRNTASASRSFTLTQSVRGLNETVVLAETCQSLDLAAGEERTVTETIPLPDAELWSQEAPNLYVLTTSTGSDTASTRFGVREFKFDTATRRAYLNGKPIFLRGGNICLHRFFDDEKSGTLPWDEAWVRKLLGPIPRKMHWNAVKFTVGPVPEKWLDIADEEGLLVLSEFPLWTLSPAMTGGYEKSLDTAALRDEYEAWLGDNWNHPSIVYWAASLESKLPEEQADHIIASIRKLDLSNRPWGNSWNPPQGPDDPHEYKQYVSIDPTFDLAQMEFGSGIRRASYDPPTGHAAIITEFDWLWLNRDGSPTPYTTGVWENMALPHGTADERFRTLAYILAGMIEYWRAHRNYAGVIYLSYLSQGWVVDNFRDVENLTFQPYFEKYVGNAFKRLGVCLSFWQKALEAGSNHTFDVMMINDEGTPTTGEIAVVVEDQAGNVLASASRPFEIAAYGQMTYLLTLEMPAAEGDVTVKAVATPSEGPQGETTTSRRFLQLEAEGSSPGPGSSNSSAQQLESGGQFD